MSVNKSKHEDDLLRSLGFAKDEEDPMFPYSYALIPEEEIKAHELNIQDVPKLLIGTSGLYSGFCLYTGAHFIWLNCTDPEDAIQTCKKIVAFEEV